MSRPRVRSDNSVFGHLDDDDLPLLVGEVLEAQAADARVLLAILEALTGNRYDKTLARGADVRSSSCCYLLLMQWLSIIVYDDG